MPKVLTRVTLEYDANCATRVSFAIPEHTNELLKILANEFNGPDVGPIDNHQRLRQRLAEAEKLLTSICVSYASSRDTIYASTPGLGTWWNKHRPRNDARLQIRGVLNNYDNKIPDVVVDKVLDAVLPLL